MGRGRRAAKRYCTLASSTRDGRVGTSKRARRSTSATALLFSVEVNRTFSVDVGKSEFPERRLGTKQGRYLRCRRCPNCAQMSPGRSSEGVGYTCHPPLMHTRSQTCSLILYEGRVCDMPPRGSCAHARQLMLRFATTNYRLTDARIKYKR